MNRTGRHGSRNIFSVRARTPDRAQDQWKLALWCEENGLKQQASADLYQVIRLDPSREAAWKRLGFKKIGGHWDKPERLAAVKAEAQQQHKANEHWRSLLAKWREALFEPQQDETSRGREFAVGSDRSSGCTRDLGRVCSGRTRPSKESGRSVRPG